MRRWLLFGMGLLVSLGMAGLVVPAVGSRGGSSNPIMELLVTDCSPDQVPVTNTPVILQLYRGSLPLGGPWSKNTDALGRLTYTPPRQIQAGDLCVVTITPFGQSAYNERFTFGAFAGLDDLIIWFPSENPLNEGCSVEDPCCTTGEPLLGTNMLWQIRFPD